MNPQEQTDYDQPVAYDKDGRPLYVHPPAGTEVQAAAVHVTRAVDPVDPQVSPETARRHDESVKKYPGLNLSKGEYVITEVPRHWVGLVTPLVVGGLLAVVVCAGLILYPSLAAAGSPPASSIVLPAILLLVLIAIGTYIPVWVYRNNRFYLTNESAIQDIQTSLFSRREQTVSLGSVEDASFSQTGLLQLLLGYGTIRLSTVGDEDTYTFTCVADPKEYIATLNDAVEAFKNGRPVRAK